MRNTVLMYCDAYLSWNVDICFRTQFISVYIITRLCGKRNK